MWTGSTDVPVGERGSEEFEVYHLAVRSYGCAKKSLQHKLERKANDVMSCQ